ncbi:potassium-transporting ATPase subunit F [Chthonomonas sp.]
MIEQVFILFVTFCVFVYLFYALFYPERF